MFFMLCSKYLFHFSSGAIVYIECVCEIELNPDLSYPIEPTQYFPRKKPPIDYSHTIKLLAGVKFFRQPNVDDKQILSNL